MKYALISDIHSNLVALEAVLADIRRQGVRRILCLGDIIGYGPEPNACIDLVRQHCELTILGNHDQAAMFEPDGFNSVALRAIQWTRDQIDRGPGGSSAINGRWDFLGELPTHHIDGETLYVHGSPRDPTCEYVFPEDAREDRKMRPLFDLVPRVCFQGHTHVPGVFVQGGDFLEPPDIGSEYRLGGKKVMVNVGSVGQPRDGNPKACYVLVDDDLIRFQRVAYDVEKTANKIFSIPELDVVSGQRILSGR